MEDVEKNSLYIVIHLVIGPIFWKIYQNKKFSVFITIRIFPYRQLKLLSLKHSTSIFSNDALNKSLRSLFGASTETFSISSSFFLFFFTDSFKHTRRIFEKISTKVDLTKWPLTPLILTFFIKVYFRLQ